MIKEVKVKMIGEKDEKWMTCPECGKKFEDKRIGSVFVDLDPELKEKVMDKSIFNARCPYCSAHLGLENPFTYVDHENRFWLLLTRPENVDEVKEKLMSGKSMFGNDEYLKVGVIRIVTDVRSLVEKIEILENGYDDRKIECLKLLYLPGAFGQFPVTDYFFTTMERKEDPSVKDPVVVYYSKQIDDFTYIKVDKILEDGVDVFQFLDEDVNSHLVVDDVWFRDVIIPRARDKRLKDEKHSSFKKMMNSAE